MKLTVNVTQENIDQSEAQSTCKDPIALAVSDAHKIRQLEEWENQNPGNDKKPSFLSSVSVHADHGNISITPRKHWHFDLPPMAQKFIVARDAGKRMKPFSFDIECEERAIKSALDTMREEDFGEVAKAS